MIIKSIISVLAGVIVVFQPVLAQQAVRPDSSTAPYRPDYTLIVAAWVGGIYGVSAHDFF